MPEIAFTIHILYIFSFSEELLTYCAPLPPHFWNQTYALVCQCVFTCVCVCVSVGLPSLDRPDILLTLISELAASELVNIFGLGDITFLTLFP